MEAAIFENFAFYVHFVRMLLANKFQKKISLVLADNYADSSAHPIREHQYTILTNQRAGYIPNFWKLLTQQKRKVSYRNMIIHQDAYEGC